jgi:hypothetical protein
MGRFLTPLRVELIAHDPAKWKLTDPLIYDSKTVGKIIVPEGYVTDFASVPRVPIAYLLTGGLAHAAAVVHDYLYTSPHETGTGRWSLGRKQIGCYSVRRLTVCGYAVMDSLLR